MSLFVAILMATKNLRPLAPRVRPLVPWRHLGWQDVGNNLAAMEAEEQLVSFRAQRGI